MMEKILLNILLFLGVVWMLLGIVYFCFQLFPFRTYGGKKKEGDTTDPSPEKEPEKEENAHILVGRSKAFTTPSIPRVPAVSSSEKSIENPNIFAGQNAQKEQQTVDEAEASEEEGNNMEEEENEMQISYTMDEPDEDAIVREELQIADEAMPEATPTAILARDLERVSRWSRKDDSLDDEDEAEVHETLRTIRGTDLMEYMKRVTLLQALDHQKLLAAIRKAEESEQVEDTTAGSSDKSGEGNDEDREEKPLSYYL
ncbi:hypothetical protein [Bacteroides heparinolyticus]|uniref:hypothetical protein n=1 Tax=Prevotella heparinolytica TaxID=28113 RepID=UPI0035A189FE